METITIQGHRGQRTVEVKRKRNFLAQLKTGVVTPSVEPKPVVKTISIPETSNRDIDKDMAEYESGLLAMIGQFNEDDPRRLPRRKDRRDSDEDHGNKQPYRRDKTWRK